MALVAIHAVVHVPAHVRVLEIVRVPAPVATRTLENHVVVRIRVAGGTDTVSVAVIHVKPGVVESCAGPRSSVVASHACRCEDGRRGLVDRIRCCSIIRRMAAVAIRRESGVIVVYMATGASHLHVETRQREGCGAMVEFPVGPQSGVMTQIASRGKPDLNMINRRGRRIVILQMA